MGFFAHILGYIYQYSDCDKTQLCGDVNSKLGKLNDYVTEVDSIPPRHILEEVTNKHGSVFHEFLIDSKTCVVNGRITPE